MAWKSYWQALIACMYCLLMHTSFQTSLEIAGYSLIGDVLDHRKQSPVVLLQGWQMLPHDETSFFAAVNLPLLDFNSRTGPQAGFDTGLHSLNSMLCPA